MTSQATEIEPSGDAPDWRDRAACRDQATRDHDPWHPPEGRQEAELYAEARQICDGCPVRSDCLAVALALLARTGELHGMWAGMTADELRRYARATGRPARKVPQHGTRSRYVTGCRCDPCRAANRRDRAQRRALEPVTAADAPQQPRSRGGPWSWR